MNLIVAVDSNWGIGCRGNLWCQYLRICAFKEMTTGKTVLWEAPL